MNIVVRSQCLELDGAMRTHVVRRLQFALGRFSLRILGVTVQIVDLNGPRGGEDKACRIAVRLLPTGGVFVEDVDADLGASIDRAVDRAARSVSRAIKRARKLKRSTAPSGPDTARVDAIRHE